MDKARSKLKMKDGSPRPKQKPRGISKLRMLDPSIPNPLTPHQWQPGQSGNPSGRSAKTRVSEAIVDELKQIDPKTGLPESHNIARGLVARAKVDSAELDRVLRITEPEKFGANFSSFEGGMVKAGDVSVVFGRLLEKD